jgi:hypothetical protein
VLLIDVHVLVHAHREDAPGHEAYRLWLEETIAGDVPFAVPELVLSGFLRVVTHPRIFAPPTPLEEALAALAIESGSEWITTDRDFARFPGLR